MQGTNAQYIGNGYNNNNNNNGNSNNNNDDENSQAEGQPVEGAVGYVSAAQNAGNQNANNSNMNNNSNNNANSNSNSNSAHYENLYESVEPYPAAAIVNPAQQQQQLPSQIQNPVGRGNLSGGAASSSSSAASASGNNNMNGNIAQPYHPLAYRNELYDRTSGYDIPRKVRHANPDVNRVRYANYPRTRRQRSFDDTESYQYGSYADYARYENMYEKVKEEPEYQNSGAARYGRLDVIGHGIGRIERHLSSSCGNIDHYSLGGHYAVLGHSHLGTVGHIRLNPAASQQNSKDQPSVKSFFSCLGGENSQSMTNIDRAGGETTAPSGTNPNRANSGAVPKQNKKQQTQANTQRSNYEAPPQHNPGTLNRISKSSLQWLLVNKWLPLWAGEGPDYKIIDFNFMFSRKCEGCDDTMSHPNQGLVRFNGQAEMRPHIYEGADVIPPPREYPTMNGHYPRVIRPVPQQLSRLNESGEYVGRHGNEDLYDRPRCRDFQTRRDVFNQEPVPVENHYHDPFRNWAFNFDDNTFRPAGNRPQDRQETKAQTSRNVRRITDGTFPKMMEFGQSVSNIQPIPSTSRTESDSACSSQSSSVQSVVAVTIENANDPNASRHHEANDNTESYASNRSSDSADDDDDVIIDNENPDDDDNGSPIVFENDQ